MTAPFKLVEEQYDKVILKIDVNDTLTVAKHPYVNLTMDYITVTRGEDKILTIIYKDGTTFSFHWGHHGYTLISENMEMLREKVVSFIENDCHILLDMKKDKIYKAVLFYNPNYKSWQLTVNGRAYIWFKNATCLDDAMEFAENYVEVVDWKKTIAPTGRDVWEAILR